MVERGKEFVCSYQFDGAEWGITIHAASEQEASRRMRAIGMTGRVDGELVAVIPAYPGTGLLLRPLIALRNLIFGANNAK